MNGTTETEPELDGIVEQGERMLAEATMMMERLNGNSSTPPYSLEGTFNSSNYGNWYLKACSVIQRLRPEHLDEFESSYQRECEGIINSGNYVISDYFRGIYLTRNFDSCEQIMQPSMITELGCTINRLSAQLNILSALRGYLGTLRS